MGTPNNEEQSHQKNSDTNHQSTAAHEVDQDTATLHQLLRDHQGGVTPNYYANQWSQPPDNGTGPSNTGLEAFGSKGLRIIALQVGDALAELLDARRGNALLALYVTLLASWIHRTRKQIFQEPLADHRFMFSWLGGDTYSLEQLLYHFETTPAPRQTEEAWKTTTRARDLLHAMMAPSVANDHRYTKRHEANSISTQSQTTTAPWSTPSATASTHTTKDYTSVGILLEPGSHAPGSHALVISPRMGKYKPAADQGVAVVLVIAQINPQNAISRRLKTTSPVLEGFQTNRKRDPATEKDARSRASQQGYTPENFTLRQMESKIQPTLTDNIGKTHTMRRSTIPQQWWCPRPTTPPQETLRKLKAAILVEEIAGMRNLREVYQGHRAPPTLPEHMRSWRAEHKCNPKISTGNNQKSWRSVHRAPNNNSPKEEPHTYWKSITNLQRRRIIEGRPDRIDLTEGPWITQLQPDLGPPGRGILHISTQTGEILGLQTELFNPVPMFSQTTRNPLVVGPLAGTIAPTSWTLGLMECTKTPPRYQDTPSVPKGRKRHVVGMEELVEHNFHHIWGHKACTRELQMTPADTYVVAVSISRDLWKCGGITWMGPSTPSMLGYDEGLHIPSPIFTYTSTDHLQRLHTRFGKGNHRGNPEVGARTEIENNTATHDFRTTHSEAGSQEINIAAFPIEPLLGTPTAPRPGGVIRTVYSNRAREAILGEGPPPENGGLNPRNMIEVAELGEIPLLHHVHDRVATAIGMGQGSTAERTEAKITTLYDPRKRGNRTTSKTDQRGWTGATGKKSRKGLGHEVLPTWYAPHMGALFSEFAVKFAPA